MLRISSRNYSSWSMRGWLLCRMAGIAFEEEVVSADDPNSRAELLLQSSSILIPSLRHEGAELWDTLAIAEYLNELVPEARMLPADRLARARCRAISGEMHAGFAALRSTLPMNLRAMVPNSRSGPARGRISSASSGSGATAWGAGAGPGCWGRRGAWRMRCMRRW
ncbi:glutathione S-transferase N-terminal domain-containing protein [Dankookia sp. P2]|uniref:glutathione S-transferase N-terminal domain-containing protein n=1 Tax=Dankookia sp. P2 TaxID=3423955 RepID=UPI003D6675FA